MEILRIRPMEASSDALTDAHKSAHFYMYYYKVVLCPKRYSHDWGACPYAHEKEKARRRDPQTFHYSSCMCPNNIKCERGDGCPYAHTLFEYWLHPARFRTQMCRSSSDCRRTLCFFAHSAEELRSPGKSGPCTELPPLPEAAPPAVVGQVGLQLQQQCMHFGEPPPAAALTAPAAASSCSQDLPWPLAVEDRSSGSFTSQCSVVTAGGSSFLPMPHNPAPVIGSNREALYAQLPAASNCSSSSPLMMLPGGGDVVPMQMQLQSLLPSNAEYLLQLQLQLQQQQQQEMQLKQATLQALQRKLLQQRDNVRAPLWEQQQAASAPMGLTAAAAVGQGFDMYQLPALSLSAAAAGQAAVSHGSTPREGTCSGLGCLQNRLTNINLPNNVGFASGPCAAGMDSSSNATAMSEPLLALAAAQQQRQMALVESWL